MYEINLDSLGREASMVVSAIMLIDRFGVEGAKDVIDLQFGTNMNAAVNTIYSDKRDFYCAVATEATYLKELITKVFKDEKGTKQKFDYRHRRNV